MTLRERVMELAGWRCEWPTPDRCERRAVEVAHLQSKGMGGSSKRDGWGNVMAACEIHARVTDGLPGPGQTVEDYRHELERLLDRPVIPGTQGTAREVWTTLQRRLKSQRGAE